MRRGDLRRDVLVTGGAAVGGRMPDALLRNRAEAEQDMGMRARELRQWTAADVLAMPEQPGKTVEVIDGELFVTPAPSFGHQGVVGLLYVALFEYVKANPVGVVCFSPADIVPAPDTLVQPDVFVAPTIGGRRPASWAEIDRLLLAIEVLSPSSQRRDRVVKRHLYARMGCEYWIVDGASRLVERWLPSDTRPEICERVLTWHPEGALTPLVLDVDALLTEALG